MAGCGLGGEGPECVGPAVHGVDSLDDACAEGAVLQADVEEGGDLACGPGGEGCVVDTSLVEGECDCAFGSPAGELIAELASGGHAPEGEGGVCELGVAGLVGEFGECVEEGLSAASFDVAVLLDEHLLVVVVGEVEAEEGEAVAGGDVLPVGCAGFDFTAFGHLQPGDLGNPGAGVEVGAVDSDEGPPQGSRVVGEPEAEVGLVVVVAGGDGGVVGRPALSFGFWHEWRSVGCF